MLKSRERIGKLVRNLVVRLPRHNGCEIKTKLGKKEAVEQINKESKDEIEEVFIVGFAEVVGMIQFLIMNSLCIQVRFSSPGPIRRTCS